MEAPPVAADRPDRFCTISGVAVDLLLWSALSAVAEAEDGYEAVELVRRHRPSSVLLDIQMPRLNGLDAAAEIRRAVPGTAVIMLTTFGEDEFVSRALQNGADGFLLKSGNPRELIASVHAVAAGGAYLSPQVTAQVIAGLRDGRVARTPPAAHAVTALSDREREVLALVGTGLSNAEIGRRLHLVEGTVKAHVSTIFTRLGVRNRVQAAVLAHQAGLVDDPA